ncbi:MAG: FecR domain-containing protein [Alphaproteobacteria bacterium]
MSLQHAETTHETVASLGAHTASDGPAPIILEATGDGDAISVPGGTFLLHATFGREAGDLVLSGVDGQPDVVIRDYFDVAMPPTLETDGGARIEGALAARLAGSPTPGQYAAADDPSGSEPIGKVAELTGEATATRLDGTTLTLAKDMPVFQGDVIETGEGAALEIVFIDESTFAVGENGRMVLDELVYDPATLNGQSSFSVIEGVFVFVSGGIAENNPEQMIVKTPVATMGIRGTAVMVQAAQESVENVIILLSEKLADGQEATGSVLVLTDAGWVVLDEPNEAVALDSIFASPNDTYYALPEDIAFLIRRLQDAIPDSVKHLEGSEEEDGSDELAALGDISPAAGGEPEDTGPVSDFINVTNGDPLAATQFGVITPPTGPGFEEGPEGEGDSSGRSDVIPQQPPGEGAPPPEEEPLALPTPPAPDHVLSGGLVKLAESVGPNDVIMNGVRTTGPLGGSFIFAETGNYLVAWGAADEGDFIIDSPLLLDGVFLNDTLIDDFSGEGFTFDGFAIPEGADVTFVGAFNGLAPLIGTGQLKFDGGNLSAATIEAFLGLPQGALSALIDDGNPDTVDVATVGSLLLLNISANAGDVLSFGYNFVDFENNGGPNGNFNDFAFFYTNAAASEGDAEPTSGDDVLIGTSGNDVIDALGGNDTVAGSSGDDSLFGNDGNDVLYGGAGADYVEGGNGNDVLFGGAGNDVLDGGIGADYLSGGTGINTLIGGPDADRFAFQSTADGIQVTADQAYDGPVSQVTDFQSGIDLFSFVNTAFGFDAGTTGTLAEIEADTGNVLFSTVANYDGTGVTGEPDSPHFIFDPTSGTLYYDADVATPGYTVMAQVQPGDSVTAADIQVTDSSGGTQA